MRNKQCDLLGSSSARRCSPICHKTLINICHEAQGMICAVTRFEARLTRQAPVAGYGIRQANHMVGIIDFSCRQNLPNWLEKGWRGS
ncbi:hypothetical protein SAMN05444851_0151 [Aliiroseovarius sediminilitoris]|uniref:Uncharacterized protein n=1 Tax=Aliiroseovarius sediminilitoris TaxID=1173584 RepID=A0A1I0MN74_9RHOB|nr:hypothetical protein SAMN05444851_0151 [Aliiroseovarius sediminilitoris]